jgi:hypothetical protein
MLSPVTGGPVCSVDVFYRLSDSGSPQPLVEYLLDWLLLKYLVFLFFVFRINLGLIYATII